MDTFSKIITLFQNQLLTDSDFLVFFILASIIFLTAIAVVLQKNLVRAGFTLIGCFGAIALFYFSLGAELVAASQILIYAVGITLVVIFAIMLLAGSSENAKEPAEEQTHWFKKGLQKGGTFALPFISFILISYSLIGLSSSIGIGGNAPQSRIGALTTYVDIGRKKALLSPSLDRIGEVLLSEQILAFELVSVLLLVAFVSAIVLSKRKA